MCGSTFQAATKSDRRAWTHRRDQRIQVREKKVQLRNPATGAHTNTVESMWRRVKGSMPSSNRNKKMMGSYLAEYVYRKFDVETCEGKYA
ncbi:hypothetical protein ANN_00297 [Periplaneta americana]|uniref:ISXO2-like transposase domain-containing protein n=1 Tax=Periplaneta americana TaxID=6978 RepID=A0ABQ8TUG1_PERAM|nr:hypothetical protein ANN_00297 [Periplaneta americana]